MICLGSCLDFQAVARSSSYERHHDRKLFGDLAREMHRNEQHLRSACLRHQAQIIEERLVVRADDPAALIALRKEVSDAMVNASVS
jgi:hypothetical protein